MSDAPVVPLEDGWIEWKGGECPVSTPLVETKHRGGAIQGPVPAHVFWWEHRGMRGDIIAYRLAAPVPARDELVDAARKAYRACMSAWAAGEPPHRVEIMLAAVSALGSVLGEPGETDAPARAALTASRSTVGEN